MFGRQKAKRENKRGKSLYVDTRVQGTLARRVVFHFLMFIVVGAMVGLFLQFLGDPFKPIRSHISAFWSQSGPYIVALLCMLPVFVKDTVALTHRMAGPIVRLRSHIRAIAEGEDVDPLKFRDGDFFRDLPPLFNQMIEKLNAGETDGLDELLRKAAEVAGVEDTVEMPPQEPVGSSA